MKTLTEMSAAEAAERARAAQYEKLLHLEKSLVITIDRLEKETIDLEPIKTIHALAGAVPSGFHTTGSYECRYMLIKVSSDLLDQATRRQKEMSETLKKAKAQLAKTREALKEFDS
jgi:hypothetical protein